MIITVGALVVLAQIVLFQFIAALANRAIIIQELGSIEGPAPGQVTNHAGRAPVVRMAIGGALGCVVIVALFALKAAPLFGGLLLVAVSAVSAVAFLTAQAKDRVIMRALAEATPGGSVRRASLERRSLTQWYHPALEVVPIIVFVATTLFLVGSAGFMLAGEDGVGPEASGERLRVLVLFGLQGLVVVGGLVHLIRKGVDVGSMAQYIPSLRQRPEVALRLGEEMAGTQLRFFIFGKIGIACLLGALVVGHVLKATGQPAATLWDVLGWGIVAVFVVGFILYLRKVARISLKMQEEMAVTIGEERGLE